MSITKEIRAGICTCHGGKMEGMWSFSTSALHNPICMARRKDKDSICAKCYANQYLEFRKSLDAKTLRNWDLMTAEVYPVGDFPLLNADLFRIEAFGDVGNETQVENYIHFANKNQRTTFAWWSKNPEIIDPVVRRVGKPKNVIFIYSSRKVNECESDILAKYEWLDKVFTVHSAEYARKHGVKINCGGRKCIECRRCYTRKTGKFVNELLKGQKL